MQSLNVCFANLCSAITRLRLIYFRIAMHLDRKQVFTSCISILNCMTYLLRKCYKYVFYIKFRYMSINDFENHSYRCKNKCHDHPVYYVEVTVIYPVKLFSLRCVLYNNPLDQISDKGYKIRQVDYKKQRQKIYYARILPEAFRYISVI